METTYVSINTVQSRLMQAAAVLFIMLGIALMFYLRERSLGFFIPIVPVLLAGLILQASRNFKRQIEYNPPQGEAELQIVRRYRVIKNTSIALVVASLFALEYCLTLHLGGAGGIAGAVIILLVSLLLLTYAIVLDERFQQRPVAQS